MSCFGNFFLFCVLGGEIAEDIRENRAIRMSESEQREQLIWEKKKMEEKEKERLREENRRFNENPASFRE